MKVIGAGLPRTGTLTQKVALEMLGFGPCYHMVNLFADWSQLAVWQKTFEGERDWGHVFAGFQSEVDWPGSFYYHDLIAAYPDAKVLLSVRRPADWERSMRATVCQHWQGDTLLRHLTAASAQVSSTWGAYIELMGRMWSALGALRPDGTWVSELVEVFERHTEAVTKAVSTERLLAWDVRDGWEPLCAFLEVEVPAGPLPKLNDSASYVERSSEMSLRYLNDWWQRQHPG